MKKFAAVLKEIREERGLSQDELAALAGTTQRAVSRAEAEGSPRWDTACKLAVALGVSLDVFAGTSDAPKVAKKVRIIVTLIDGDGESGLVDIEKKLPR